MSARQRQKTINLILREQDESLSGQLLAWAFTYGRYIIIITQIVVLSVFFLRFKLDRDHTDLKEAVTQKQALIQSVADLEAEIRRVQERLSHIRSASDSQYDLIEIVTFLQEKTPSDVVFANLNISVDAVEFQATADSLTSFTLLLRELQKDTRFTEISLENIQRQNDGKVEFGIHASIRKT